VVTTGLPLLLETEAVHCVFTCPDVTIT